MSRRRLTCALIVSVVVGLTAGAAAEGDRREAAGRYVASPAHGDAYSPAAGAGLGRVDFEVQAGESWVLVTIADDVFDKTELHAVFRFGDAPVGHVVTFCRQHAMDIPNGATDMRVVVERLFPTEDFGASTCGAEHGATGGVVTARFA